MNGARACIGAGLIIGTIIGTAGCRSVSDMGKGYKVTTTKVKDLNVLAVYVTDIERSREFYSRHLGFEMAGDMAPGILMRAGQVSLYLEANRKAKRADSTPTAEFSPCFATDSVLDQLEAKGASRTDILQEVDRIYESLRSLGLQRAQQGRRPVFRR